jgi:hypothetical protein
MKSGPHWADSLAEFRIPVFDLLKGELSIQNPVNHLF